MALRFSVAALVLVANPAAQAVTRAQVDLMNDASDASNGPVQAWLGGNFGVSSNRQMGCQFGAGQGPTRC